MPTCVRMAPPRLCRENARGPASSKGWKPESLARLAACGTNPQAGSPRLSRRVPRPMLGTIKKQIHPGETITMHRISLLRGHHARCICSPADGRRAGADRGAERASHLHRRRRDGGRAGQRQEGRLQHHHHGRQRPRRPLQLPRQQDRARPVCAPHPRRRLRPRQSQEHRRRAAENHHARSQAAQDRGPRRPAVRMPNGSTAFRATIRARAFSSIAWAATPSNASCARSTPPKNS